MSKSELTYHEGMQKIEKNLQQVELAINYREENLRQLDIKINGRDENDLKELQEEARHRKEYISRKEQFVKSRDFTKGRHILITVSHCQLRKVVLLIMLMKSKY
ncbi:hypothetical protein PGH42_00880 [Legionella pneumophila]|nr:hypothetical protein PGH42_00880 [Legionella pneumophila]